MKAGMKDVIKVQFVKDCKAGGREYTYYSPETVSVGDIVDVETAHGVTQAQVSQINVPLEEISRFADRAKAIIGKTACRCEDCEMLEADSGDGTATRACRCAESRFPILLNMRCDDYLWCMGCFFQKAEAPGTIHEADGGQQTLAMPAGSRTPWDKV